MKVPANQTTIDTIQQYEKIVRFSNQELKLTVNGSVEDSLYIKDGELFAVCGEHYWKPKVVDGMFDLVVERVSTQDITNLMFW